MPMQAQAIDPSGAARDAGADAARGSVSVLLRTGLSLWCLLVVACGGGKSPTSPSGAAGDSGVTLTALRVSGDSGASVGDKVQLTAEAVSSDGSTTTVTAQAKWSSGTPAVASVSSAGMVTALSVGSTIIEASLQGRSGTRAFEVRKGAPGTTLKEVRVSQVGCGEPCQQYVFEGDKVQMKAEAVYTDGSTTDVTTRSSWSSNRPAGAVVDSKGLVTAIDAGLVEISAKFEGATGRDTVQVYVHYATATITLQRFECIADCEDFTQGAGDFTYWSSIAGLWFFDQDVAVQVAKGESRNINARFEITTFDTPGREVDIEFCATEWDLGLSRDVPDSGMNNLCKTARYPQSSGRWIPEGANYITLGSGPCVVRLHYFISDVFYSKPR